jgi:protein-tyrosine-phosphatase
MMAEGLMRQRWSGEVGGGLAVSSMGIHGMDGYPPTDFAIQVCAENNITIAQQLSRPFAGEEIRQADLVLVMEPVHKEFLKIFYPSLDDMVFLLSAWPERSVSKKAIIKDPVGGTIRDYRKTFQLLSGHIDRIIPLLRNEYGF